LPQQTKRNQNYEFYLLHIPGLDSQSKKHERKNNIDPVQVGKPVRQAKNHLLYWISLPDILQNIRRVDPKYRNPMESESGQKPETIPRSMPRNKQ